MKLDEFVGKPCRSKVAFEFVPKHSTKINLEESVKELRKEFLVEVESKLLLIVRIADKNISIFPSGKILVRNEKIEQEARNIAERVVKKLKTN